MNRAHGDGGISMAIRALVRATFKVHSLLPALAVGASLAMMISATTQVQAEQFALKCAQRDVLARTTIDDHGAVGDLPSDLLGNAGLTMLRAQMVCYEGRVDEALALYDSILDLGPVPLLRR